MIDHLTFSTTNYFSFSLNHLFRYIVPKRPLDCTDDNTNDPSMQPPPNKKKKTKGQNKYRPPVKIPFSSQLCPTFHIGSHKKCSFGEKCRYLHDISKFLQLKPQDISDTCYVFETYGYCPSGLACRYGGGHIDSLGTNVINKELYRPDKGLNKVVNGIPRTLQEELRKRKIQFPRSDNFLKTIVKQDSAKAVEKSSDNNNSCSVVGAVEPPPNNQSTESSQLKEEEMGEVKNDATSTVEEEKEALVSNECSEELHSSADASIQMKSDGDVVSQVGGVAVSQPRPTGPITDEDTIRLKPTEKKRIDFRDKLYLAPLTTVSPNYQ